MWVVYLILLFVTWKLLSWLLGLFKVGNYGDRYVLITGCDSGFGHDLAIKLDAMRLKTFATCYNEKGVTELTKKCSKCLVAMEMDVTNDDSIKKALKEVTETVGNRGLWGLVNNAGLFGLNMPLELLDMEHIHDPINVNLYGMIRVTKAFLPLVRKAKGRIVNTSSTSGRVAFCHVPYSVSKYGIEGFSDKLRYEMLHSGVTVHIVTPGTFVTGFVNLDYMEKEGLKLLRKADTEVQEYYGENFVRETVSEMKANLPGILGSRDKRKVVNAYTHAVTSRFPKYRYIVGLDANMVFRLWWASPERLQNWLYRVSFKVKPAGCMK